MRNLFTRQQNGMRWAHSFLSFIYMLGMGRGWWIWNKVRSSMATVGSAEFLEDIKNIKLLLHL